MHVLIVEHNPERLRLLTGALPGAGYRLEGAGTAGAALAALARPVPPDLVLLQDRPPDMSALDFLQAADGMGPRVPVVLLGTDEGAARGVEATRLGAIDFVMTDGEGLYLRTLAARIRGALEYEAQRDRAARMSDALTSTAAAVIIADRAGRIEVVNEACARLLGRDVQDASRGALGDLFPLDNESRIKTDFLAAVHACGEWAGELDVLTHGDERVSCIVTLSPIRRVSSRIDGLVLTLRDVSDRVAMEDALRAANRRLADLASRDVLTGLYNRGYFREVLDREMARAVRYGDVLSVVMVDLDDFKDVNDDYGHPAGDEALRHVAVVLRPHLRDGDVLARYGGDEFCILLPNTDAESALRVAERLRAAIEEQGGGPEGLWHVRLSAGLATSDEMATSDDSPTDVLLHRADRALYASKDAGGNRVTTWTPELA